MDDLGDYMSFPVLSIDSESTVQEAARYMQAKHVGSLLVKGQGKYVGIVTETDLAQKVIGAGLAPSTTSVRAAMTRPVLSMDRYLPVEQANEFMFKNKIRHLAVTEMDEIVGVLSLKDLVSFYSKSFRMTE
ncbi:MAG: cyclic nucleotide-binding/CBS domain-containing protein [Nitrospinales bacterium]